MKRVVTIFFSISLILIAISCSENDLINSPVDSEEFGVQKEIIEIPKPAESLLYKTSVSKEIDGTIGGTLSFNLSYETVNGESVTIKGNLTVPAGAFNYTSTITAVVDEEYATLDFYPSPTTFDQPLILDLEYSGLQLNQNAADADFYFITDDLSSFEQIDKAGKDIDLEKGELVVYGALLNHFSRFGWAI